MHIDPMTPKGNRIRIGMNTCHWFTAIDTTQIFTTGTSTRILARLLRASECECQAALETNLERCKDGVDRRRHIGPHSTQVS